MVRALPPQGDRPDRLTVSRTDAMHPLGLGYAHNGDVHLDRTVAGFR